MSAAVSLASWYVHSYVLHFIRHLFSLEESCIRSHRQSWTFPLSEVTDRESDRLDHESP